MAKIITLQEKGRPWGLKPPPSEDLAVFRYCTKIIEDNSVNN
jgi:hypothetical protein